MLVATLPAAAAQLISHGRFKDVAVYAPKGQAQRFVLMLSGDAGWNDTLTTMAQELSKNGALVAGINAPQVLADFGQDGGECILADGDLENLSHYIQAYYRLPTYHTPVLVGYGSGAALTYAMLAQAPADTFAAGVSLGFCPTLQLAKPLCQSGNLQYKELKRGRGTELLPTSRLAVPWIAMQADAGASCKVAAAQSFAAKVSNASFVGLHDVGKEYVNEAHWLPQYSQAYLSVSAANQQRLPEPPRDLSDLPLIEVTTAVPATQHVDTFAIVISGDGGWAGLDQQVAAALSEAGIPVAGMDSLRYFWSKRTPEGLAADLHRIIRYYSEHWQRAKVILIGYSQGADVMPFALSRLPKSSHAAVKATVLLALSTTAAFEFHLSNWVTQDDDALPVEPEIAKLKNERVLCLYGEDEKDSLCPSIMLPQFKAVKLRGGHHFDGDYKLLAKLILQHASLVVRSALPVGAIQHTLSSNVHRATSGTLPPP
jgi:type IV secretory pathway VirJ component